MGYDAIQCTRSYLTLWKLVDRLFPESRWLEAGIVPDAELRTNAERMLKADLTDLNWCDKPEQLRDYARSVLALREEPLVQGIIAKADKLRDVLRDRALQYAQTIERGNSEWPSKFNWELRRNDGA